MIPMIIMAIEDEDDRSFMANLYVDYQRLMYKVIASYTTNKWDADDIFQSTLPKLIDKLADLRRMSKDKLTNYIYSTCKNTAINYLQKKAVSKSFLLRNCLQQFLQMKTRGFFLKKMTKILRPFIEPGKN